MVMGSAAGALYLYARAERCRATQPSVSAAVAVRRSGSCRGMQHGRSAAVQHNGVGQ